MMFVLLLLHLQMWYEKNIPSLCDKDDEMMLSSLDDLTALADEVTILNGLGRDDIREMLMALLPDKRTAGPQEE